MLADTAFTPDNLYPSVFAHNPSIPFLLYPMLMRPNPTFLIPSPLSIQSQDLPEVISHFRIALLLYRIHLDFPSHPIDCYPSPSVHS
jgi:hypothetical protein